MCIPLDVLPFMVMHVFFQDKDGDGTLDYEEFVNEFTHMRTLVEKTTISEASVLDRTRDNKGSGRQVVDRVGFSGSTTLMWTRRNYSDKYSESSPELGLG